MWSGLPDEARRHVANTIMVYCDWKNSPPAPTPAETRSQLEQAESTHFALEIA